MQNKLFTGLKKCVFLLFFISLRLKAETFGSNSSEHFALMVKHSRMIAESVDSFEIFLSQIENWLKDDQHFLEGVTRLNAIIAASSELEQTFGKKKGVVFLEKRIQHLKKIALEQIWKAVPGSKAAMFIPAMEKNDVIGFLFKDDFDEIKSSLNKINVVFTRPWGAVLANNINVSLEHSRMYYQSLESFLYLILNSSHKIIIDEKIQSKFVKTLEAAFENGEQFFSSLKGGHFRKDLQEIILFMLELKIQDQPVFNSAVIQLQLNNLYKKIENKILNPFPLVSSSSSESLSQKQPSEEGASPKVQSNARTIGSLHTAASKMFSSAKKDTSVSIVTHTQPVIQTTQLMIQPIKTSAGEKIPVKRSLPKQVNKEKPQSKNSALRPALPRKSLKPEKKIKEPLKNEEKKPQSNLAEIKIGVEQSSNSDTLGQEPLANQELSALDMLKVNALRNSKQNTEAALPSPRHKNPARYRSSQKKTTVQENQDPKAP